MFGKKKRLPVKKYAYGPDKNGIVGVTLGWAASIQLEFEGGFVYYGSSLDWELHSEYFPEGKNSWPVSPETREKLPVNYS